MITFPNAKINLGLNITEKRPDGYHNLETVFYPIPLEDALEITILNDSKQKFVLHQSGLEISGGAGNQPGSKGIPAAGTGISITSGRHLSI